MASVVTKRVILHTRRKCLESSEVSPRDDALLHAFLQGEAEDSEAAFRSLVARHGPMVMGVCRQVLNQDQDAEDAFQATFLTLARRAATIRDRRFVAAWLYEVAYRIAIRARSNAARRRDQEKRGAGLAAQISLPQVEREAAWTELRPVLHDEVNRLPDKYRLPIILSYLEGRTNEEVADLLRWPVGTVKGRLSRARELLRTRLVRRGLALSAAFLCTSLSHGVVFAEVVSASLVNRTIRTVFGPRLTEEPLPEYDDAPTMSDGEQTIRANELASDVNGKSQRPKNIWLLRGLVAFLALLTLATIIVFTDPISTRRFSKFTSSMIASGSQPGCHAVNESPSFAR